MHRRLPIPTALVALGCLLGPTLACTQLHVFGARPSTATIVGTIIDPATSAPIADAAIWVEGATRAARTNADGRFVLSGVGLGPQTIHVSQPKYLDFRLADVRTTSDTLRLYVELHSNPVTIVTTFTPGPNARVGLGPSSGPAPLIIVGYSADSIAVMINTPDRTHTWLDSAAMKRIESIEVVGNKDGARTRGIRNWGMDGSGGVILITLNGAPPFSWVL